MTRLSVNVNKFALLRNARGQNRPNLLRVVEDLVGFGVKGITAHPRPDERHILYQDVKDIKNFLKEHPLVEFNVEGYPDDSFLQLMEQIAPNQCTLVPDPPDALTSNAGWKLEHHKSLLAEVLAFLKKHQIRASLFIDPFTLDKKQQAVLKSLAPPRVELYTKEYADSWPGVQKESVTATYTRTAEILSTMGIEINAGHDLNLDNLPYFLKKVPYVREVSIGHALVCEALYGGLKEITHAYLQICQA